MSPIAPPSPPFPTSSGSLLVPGPAGALEVAVDLPDPAHLRRGVAVLAHPNPPDGGLAMRPRWTEH